MKNLLILIALSLTLTSLAQERDILFDFDSSQSYNIGQCEAVSNICKPFKLQDENGNFSETIYRKIYICFAYGEEIYMALPQERMKIYTSEKDCLKL